MKLRTLLLLGLALLGSPAWAQLSFGTATLIDDGWRFALGDPAEAAQPQFDDQGWQRVELPHDWSIKARMRADLASCTGYLPGGVAWYRKTFTLPKSGGEKVYVYFEGVYNRSEVYLNGHLLGKRPNGYVSFYYDLTPYLVFDRENVLAVRVDHHLSADSRWYSGSGIYRDVYLVRSGPVHLEPWGVFVRPESSGADGARIHMELQVRNEAKDQAPVTARQELLSADGRMLASTEDGLSVPVGGVATLQQTLSVPEPHRWSLEDPYLYRVRTTLLRDGREIDRTVTRTGIRVLGFDPDRGFSLNGVGMKLKGVCLHHDAGVLGAAVPRGVWERRLRALKSIGCNAIRTSHNPQAPELYDLCDELGLLVLDEAFDEWEFPKRKWLRGWNVGEPGFEGSFDFFKEWSDRDLADMVLRDRNHPSVFAWSIGNEVDYPNDPYSHPILNGAKINQPMYGGYKPGQPDANRLGAIAQRLVAVVKRFDRSRPVTAALAGVVMSNETAYPGALDIVGYNYTEERYAEDHARYPKRILYGSENGHSLQAWLAVRDNPSVMGQFLWTGIDYLGEAGPWPARGADNGLLDFTGAVKPRGHFREALWSDRPVAYLGTWRARGDDRVSIDAPPVWNYPAGTRVRVFCYTNAASAQLSLNGTPVEGERPRDDRTGVITWELPFEPGTLEVVGHDAKGLKVCRSRLVTAGPAMEMRVDSDAAAIGRDRGLAVVSVQLVDREGTPVMSEEREVTCRVEGPARLLGLEAGNIRDTSDLTDTVQAVHHGRLVAYVQATGGEGVVRVRFSAPGLPDRAVELQVE